MPERMFTQTPSNSNAPPRRPSGNSTHSNSINSRPSAARTLTSGMGQPSTLAEAQKRNRRSNTELRLDDRQLGDLSRDVRDAEAFLNSVRDATLSKAQRVDEMRKNRERKAQMDARMQMRSPHLDDYDDDDVTDYTETQSDSESLDNQQERSRDDESGGGHVVPADDDGDTSTVPSGDAPPPPSGQFLSRTAVADLAARLRDRQHLMRFGNLEAEGSGFEGRSRSAATLDDDSPPQRPLSGNLDSRRPDSRTDLDSRRPDSRNERVETRNDRIEPRDIHDVMSEASSTYSADIAAKREELMRLQQRRAQELKALRDFREQLERWEQEHPLSDSATETTATHTDESSVVKFDSPPPRRRGRSREPRIIAASAVNTRSKSEHRSAQKAPVPPPPPPPERFQYGKRATATMPNTLSISSISNRPPSGQSMTPRRPMVANRGKSPGHSLTQPNSVLAASLQQSAEQRKRAMMHQASTGLAAPRRTPSGNNANNANNNLDIVFERPSNTSSSVSSTQFLPPGTQLPSNFNNTRTHAMLSEELVKAPRAPPQATDEWEESTLASVSSAGGFARRQIQRQAEQRNRVMNDMAQANRDNDLVEQDEYQTDSSTSFLTAEALAQLEQHNEAQRKAAAPMPLPQRQNSRTPTPPRPLTKPPSPPNPNGQQTDREYDSKTDTESALANEVEQLQLLALKLEVQAAENRGLNTDNNRFIADIRQFLRDNGMSDSAHNSKYNSLQRKNGSSKPGRIEILDHNSLISRLSASSNPAASPRFIWRSADGKWHCFSPS